MAYADTRTSSTGALSLLARPFVSFGNLLVRIGENTSIAKAVTRLSEMSDEELAAKGTTRSAQAEKIFSRQLYL